MSADIARLRELIAAATALPWSLWTSNSHRRITGADGRDGGVLYGCVQRDGCDDLSGQNVSNDLALIVAAVNALPDLVSSNENMRIALEEIRAWALNRAPGSTSSFSPSTAAALATICERGLGR